MSELLASWARIQVHPTMNRQDSSSQTAQALHRARGCQGPVLAVLTMLAAKGAAARGSARLRASLDSRSARRILNAQAGAEKRRSNRTEKLVV